MAGDPSGSKWVAKFPTSKKISDLKGSFAGNMASFAKALIAAKATVNVSATYRPPERAYLMHYAYAIAKGLDPKKVPKMQGVDIDWSHNGDAKAAKKGAAEMVSAYKIVHKPALKSRHTEGLAIDMDVSWSGDLKIKDASGKEVTISSSPRTGMNTELAEVGASYGVKKLASDPPHWSSDGH